MYDPVSLLLLTPSFTYGVVRVPSQGDVTAKYLGYQGSLRQVCYRLTLCFSTWGTLDQPQVVYYEVCHFWTTFLSPSYRAIRLGLSLKRVKLT